MAFKVNKKPVLCRKHQGEPISVFSSKLKRCMCLKCAMEQHDILSDFMPLSEAVNTMKATGKAILEEMTVINENVDHFKKEQLKHMQKIRASDKTIKAQVRTIRDSINRHLDLIEQRLMLKLKQLVDKTEAAFISDQHTVQLMSSALKKVKDNITKSLNTTNGIELVTGISREKEKFKQQKLQVKEQNDRIPSQTLEFRPSDAIVDLQENIYEFGEVELKLGSDTGYSKDMHDSTMQPTSSRSSVPPEQRRIGVPNTSTPLSFTNFEKSRATIADTSKVTANHKDKYGLHVVSPFHVNRAQKDQIGFEQNDTVNKSNSLQNQDKILSIRSAYHSTPCSLTGVAVVASGLIVVCDSKHKCIQLINKQSEILDELVFHYKPCDIATVSDNNVVVSFVEKDFVRICDVSTKALTHKKDVSIGGRGGSYSIAYSKDRFAICRRGEVRIVSSDDGTLISTIQIEAHFPQIAMSNNGSKLYLSDFVGGKVTCMDDKGKTRWEYGADDFEPCSVAVDLNQLYVADVKGVVIVLSTYGILMRQLQCSGHLQAMSVDFNAGTLLITQENNRDKSESREIKIVYI